MGRLRLRPAHFLVLLLPAALCADSIRLAFQTLDPQVIQDRLESVPQSLAERKAKLIALFEGSGCEVTEQRVPQSKKAGNLICTLPGDGESTIVVGGHYDYVSKGMGAIDDWSGSVLLPSLYESLKSVRRHHRYVFVAFAAEETGLFGSKEYVKRLSKEERGAIHAMINLECLGTTPPKVWASRADKRLLSAYVGVARSLQLVALGSNVDRLGDDDSHPFLDVKIPVLTIHSITSETWPFLHNSKDNLRAIHPDDYYSAYKLATTLLALLDSTVE